jgi:hypothetical protein
MERAEWWCRLGRRMVKGYRKARDLPVKSLIMEGGFIFLRASHD